MWGEFWGPSPSPVGGTEVGGASPAPVVGGFGGPMLPSSMGGKSLGRGSQPLSCGGSLGAAPLLGGVGVVPASLPCGEFGEGSQPPFSCGEVGGAAPLPGGRGGASQPRSAARRLEQ
ncbi:unnamed protein product [Eretmochelys imbricata]